MSIVGVIGASGTVGAGTARALSRAGMGLRLGVRAPGRVRGLINEIARPDGPDVDVQALDLDDESSLVLFLSGLDAVVSCAAPTSLWSGPTARRAVAAGVPLIDPAGGHLFRSRQRRGLGECGLHSDSDFRSAVVVDAGMQPGLTGLMVRALLARAPSAPQCVGLWHGGLGTLPEGSARDLLLAGAGSGTPRVRRHAHRVVSFSRETRRVPPGIPPAARVTPVLSEEINRICSANGVPDAVEYQVIDGEHLAAVASYYAASPVRLWDEERLDEAVRRLQDAARVDCCGRRSSYTLHAWAGNDELVVTTDSPFTLTAEVAAMATLAVVEGRVDAGLFPFDEVLEPAEVLASLAVLPNLTITGGARHQTEDAVVDKEDCDMEEGEVL